MAATITPIQAPQNPDTSAREVIVDGTIVLTGNYGGGATHGDTLDLTQFGDLLKSSQLPVRVEILEQPQAGTAPSGWEFMYGIGTTQKNGVLIVNGGTGAAAGNPSQEYPQGTAYSAALLGAKLLIRAWFPLY